jgi:hypothetical protein
VTAAGNKKDIVLLGSKQFFFKKLRVQLSRDKVLHRVKEETIFYVQ